MRKLICSSHTISGVLPGGPVPARHGFAERVAACAAAGYTGMCLHFRDYRALRTAGQGDAELAAILHGGGMKDITLEFLTDWFLTGETAAQARADEATMLEAAGALGAHGFNVGADFLGRGIPFAGMREGFAALCGRAAVRGLTVALEIVPWSNVADVGSALRLVDGIPNAGLVIDSWHVFRGGIPLSDIAGLPGERILSIQVNDAAREIRGTLAEDTMRRLPCGEGAFDLDGFLRALQAAGAAVPLSVEIISPDFAALEAGEAARRSAAGAIALRDRLGF